MPEILLVRHAQSYANTRDLSFGRVESPLTERGIREATDLGQTFESEYDISPPDYAEAVLASEYTRPQQTAQLAGFRCIDIHPIINEADVMPELLSGLDVIRRHAEERWVPDELLERGARFIDMVRRGELTHKIFFTHGFFIASVQLQLADELAVEGKEIAQPWDPKRGFIPRLATIIRTTL